jgi:signal transduction histidine kinase
MLAWALPYFASGALVCVFAWLVLARGRGAVRRPMVGLLATVAGSLFAWGMLRVAGDAALALWAGRAGLAVGAWSTPAALAFGSALLDEPRPLRLKLSLAGAALSTLVALLTPWALAGAHLGRYGFVSDGGPLYLLLLLLLGATMLVPLDILRRLRRERRPLVRRQLQLMALSMLLGSLAFSDVAAPLGLELPPLAWLPLVTANLVMLLGVVRYRVLDVRLAAWRLSLWILLTASGALPFAALAAALVRGAPPRNLWETVFMGAGLLAAISAWVELVQPRVDALVGQRRRDLALEMASLEAQLGRLQTVAEVGRAVDSFLGALGRRLAALVEIDARGRPQLALSAWGAVPVPTRESPLLHELQRRRAPFSIDEVRGPARLEIERACVRWGAEYLAPLVDGEQLLGLLAISPRRHGGTPGIDEVAALDRVCVMVTAALASARLYQRLQALSVELEHKAEARSLEISRAVGDLRGAEARLLSSEKLATLGQIVAGVAADLRDQVAEVLALTGRLRASVEVLKQAGDHAQLSPDERFDEAARDLLPLLDAVSEGARRASAIAQDLSGFAPNDRAVAERRPIPLDTVVDATLGLLGAQLRDITVERRYDRTLPDVPMEPGPMGQVILNLVLNAAQAMNGRGKLTVGTRSLDEATCELFVADDGPGIPAEIQARIFEPFFTTKGPAAGSGLGLSVSFGIVERHGGQIVVDSSPRGSTFRVRLPMT